MPPRSRAAIMNTAMAEYVSVRASETLDQGDLVAFLKTRFPQITKPIGRAVGEGTECVEVREDCRAFMDMLILRSDTTCGNTRRRNCAKRKFFVSILTLILSRAERNAGRFTKPYARSAIWDARFRT